jgi:carboxypeptidase family protein/TonB-dependent receptor-like protein
MLCPALAVAQSRTGVVVGSIRDSAGQRLDQTIVRLVGASDRVSLVTSDDSGSYRLPGVAAGPAQLLARRIGYIPETLSVVIVDGGVQSVDFVLRAVPVELEGTVIQADPLRGKMGPFNTRRARGVGSFLTRSDIEKRQASSVSELLRYIPGVGVMQRMAGEPQPVQMQRSISTSSQTKCAVSMYVDGQPYPNGSVDDFPPLSIEGIEVYRSASEIPADFRTRDSMCGLIAIWTRDPDAAKRKPNLN